MAQGDYVSSGRWEALMGFMDSQLRKTGMDQECAGLRPSRPVSD